MSCQLLDADSHFFFRHTSSWWPILLQYPHSIRFVGSDRNGSSLVGIVSEDSSMTSVKLGIVFVGRTLSTSSLAESASCWVASSSSIRMCVEHVALRGVALCLNKVFYNQEHGLKMKERTRILPC